MATITTSQYLDSGTSRTAGEAWTINSGAELTIRTDSRWHSNSPASMTGSLGSITINQGKLIFDATNVRWLAFSSGSGTVPAIGTSITQAGVSSSYLLGVYSSLTSSPTPVGNSMPTTGFIKFREVSGAFTSGALTGIGATADSADVAGWIEIVCDSAATITVPRLGEHRSRGAWFYLDNTNGSIGQVLQIPTNGGGASTYCPGIWVETAPNSNSYSYWPSLYSSTNGWARQHIGAPYGATDSRQNFVKSLGSGQLQFGEASDLSATYANVTAQASTYASISHSCTYTWSDNKVTVYYATGHLLTTGAQVGLDFTSGGATANDGIYTITVLDAYYYTVDLSGSGASGNVTARPGVTVTFTAHSLGVGDTVYCDFTSGTGADGSYTIYAVTSANAYLIAYPHTAALTSGNVSVHSRYEITFTAHALAVGNRVYLDFTTGSGVDGIYTIVEVPTANTFRIVSNNSGSSDSGNVTIKQTIGNVPVSGCKVRIPNIFLRECATGTRASNMVNATITSRPEWSTSSAGAIDLEYVYSTWYHNYGQAYSTRLYYISYLDSLLATEIATALDIDHLCASMYGALDAFTLDLTSNFTGGTIKNSNFQRGNTPGTSDHALNIAYCKNLVFTNVTSGIIQYARSTGKGIYIAYCDNLTFTNCINLNSDLPLVASSNIQISNYDHCDRYIGYTNSTTAYYGLNIGAGCSYISLDGFTVGKQGTIINVHPYSGVVYLAASSYIKIRNIGSYASPLLAGNWRPNLYALAVSHVTGGNNNTVSYKRIYISGTRSGGFSTINSDKNITYESVYSGSYVYSAMAIFLQINAGLNSIIKGCRSLNMSTTAQSSVYGNHFHDIFISDTKGLFVLAFNEPTAETISQFTMVSGTAQYTSSGGILMPTIDNQAIWEDSCFRLGHTAFANASPTMSGGTIGKYTIEYQLDTGSGYSGTWATANGTNLSAETINPAIGFKMKIRITTTSTNTTAITFLRFDTITSSSAQSNNLYVLDTVAANLTLTNLQSGTEVHVYDTNTSTELYGIEATTGSEFTYSYIWTGYDYNVFITALKTGWQWSRYSNQSLGENGLIIPVFQVIDRNYSNP